MADGPQKVSGSGYSLTVTGTSTENLIGYEVALYAVRPRPTAAGYMIVPRHAERHIQGETERRDQPVMDYFQFPPEAAFYRIFYKSSQNDFTALVVAARTPVELERSTRVLEAKGASASCDDLKNALCVAIPRDVGLTPWISVAVNGAEVLVARGGNVFQAIRISGEQHPENVLPKLIVYKSWNGRMARVEFDKSDPAILRLVLGGGEKISWH